MTADSSLHLPQPTPQTPGPLCIHYCHGLESGPGGYKVRTLRAGGATVVAPDMQMSLWDPRARSGVARSLAHVAWTRRPTRWLPAAVARSRDACIALQQAALAATHPPPSVLVGSSWGGMVAAILLAEGHWQGPTVLLCPALRLIERWMVPAGPPPGPRRADAVVAALAALPLALRARCVLVHGTADTTIPLADSRGLAEATGIRLVEVAGGSHGLGRFTSEGHLGALIAAVAGEAPAPVR